MTNNGALGERDQYENEDRKTWMLKKCFKNEFWKYIGCIISEVTYCKKGYRIWVKNHKY